MKFYLLFIVFILAGSGDQKNDRKTYQQPPEYYYSGKKKIYIKTAEGASSFSVGFKEDSTAASTQSALNHIRLRVPISYLKWHNGKNAEVKVGGLGLANSAMSQLKQSMGDDPNIKYINPIYYPVDTNQNIKPNAPLTLTDQIVVKFKPATTGQNARDFAAKYQLKVVDSTLDFCVYEVARGANPIHVANNVQDSESIVQYAHPNFLIQLKKNGAPVAPTDPYFPSQFYLSNTGQRFRNNLCTTGADISILNAWAITKGNPAIVIAVIDEGISANHPDLPNTRQIRLKGSNFADGDPDDPSPTGDKNHGNACAGIIAAEHNNEGIAGIAPNCKIMPVRIPFDFSNVGVAQIASAFNLAWRNGADVISCSWGSEELEDPEQFPTIVDAIDSASIAGRGRHGCVVVFSAGNTANQQHANAGNVYFPDNVDVPDVFTVGSSDRNNQQCNYSPSTSTLNNQKIDLVTPSSKDIDRPLGEIWTLDIPGLPGDNPDKASHDTLPNFGNNYMAYDSRFGGTSASCPMVAGVAALLLSVKPTLSAHEVYTILTSTADQVGGYDYSNQNRSVELGHGKLNAARALKKVTSDN